MSSPVDTFRNHFLYYFPDEASTYLPDVNKGKAPTLRERTTSSTKTILTPENVRNEEDVQAYVKQTINEVSLMRSKNIK
jgi:hypothetical protein